MTKQTKPKVGDYIATDWNGTKPEDFKGQEINWYCAGVLEIDGDRYRVTYDNGVTWYTFTQFGEPKPNENGGFTFPAIPDNNPKYMKWD